MTVKQNSLMKQMWILCVIMIVLTVVLAVVAKPIVLQFIQLATYNHDSRTTHDLLDALRVRCPDNVNQENWEGAVGWTMTAHANIYFSAEHASHSELKLFKVKLEQEMQGEVDLDTLERLWKLMKQSGDHGRNYVDKYYPSYRSEAYGEPYID